MMGAFALTFLNIGFVRRGLFTYSLLEMGFILLESVFEVYHYSTNIPI